MSSCFVAFLEFVNVFNSFLNRMRQCERNIRKANMADDGICYDEELNMIFVDSECGRVVPLQVYFKKIEVSTVWWSFGPWLLDEIVQNAHRPVDFHSPKSRKKDFHYSL